MNIFILLICVISNICFAVGGFFAGRSIRIMQIKANEEIQIKTVPRTVQYEDEPATWLTPEQEQELEAAYQKHLGDNNGI